MKNKTRFYVESIEKACEICEAIPACARCNSPEYNFVRDLWKVRDRFLNRLMRELPLYEAPKSASLLSRAQQWPDIEAAYVLPDNRLLVLWCEFEEPEVMTESEYLHRLANRCVDLFADDFYRSKIRAFFAENLKHPV